MDKLNPKAQLMVDIMDWDGKTWTVRIHLYDETTHMAKMGKWHIEPIKGDPRKRGRMLVDCLGQVGDKVAIVLPEAIHEMGTNVSVNSKWIEKPKRPIEQIVKETLEK